MTKKELKELQGNLYENKALDTMFIDDLVELVKLDKESYTLDDMLDTAFKSFILGSLRAKQ